MEAAAEERKSGHENNEEQVFQDPRFSIKRVDRGDHPGKRANRNQAENDFAATIHPGRD